MGRGARRFRRIDGTCLFICSAPVSPPLIVACDARSGWLLRVIGGCAILARQVSIAHASKRTIMRGTDLENYWFGGRLWRFSVSRSLSLPFMF